MIVPGFILAALLQLFPACPSEDSTWCWWNASTSGNGQGSNFVALWGDVILKEES